MSKWRFVGGPTESDREPRHGDGYDGVVWTWLIERDGLTRPIHILMAGTLHASTGHPSRDAAEARASMGRNYVEAVLDQEDPPRYRTANSDYTAPDDLIDEWE